MDIMQPIVPKESQVVTACLRLLNALQIYAWRNNNAGTYRGKRGGRDIYSFHGIAGVSDIIGLCPNDGRILCVEVKRPGKLENQSEGQVDFEQQIKKDKGIYILCDSTEMLEQKLKELNIIK